MHSHRAGGAILCRRRAQPHRPCRAHIQRQKTSCCECFTPPPCTSAAAAGSWATRRPLDRIATDFNFDGQAGEKITVTLERSGASGGTGKTARLVLRDGGGRRLAGDAGALPLKLAATLPAAGSYVVEAVEAEGDFGQALQGSLPRHGAVRRRKGPRRIPAAGGDGTDRAVALRSCWEVSSTRA